MIVMIVYAATFGKEFYEIVMNLKLSSLDIHQDAVADQMFLKGPSQLMIVYAATFYKQSYTRIKQ